MSHDPLRERVGLLLDGEERFSSAVEEVRNPGRPQEVVGTFAVGDPAHIDAAVRQAAAVQKGWGGSDPADRAAALRRAAERIEEHAERLAVLASRESGSLIALCRWEATAAAQAFRNAADHLSAVSGYAEHGDAAIGDRVLVHRRPFGVVACIVPWNAPMILSANKLAAALATGNAVVMKPSPLAPLAASRLAQIVATCLSAGLVSVVGGGADVGEALLDHDLVRKVSFTGGGATARVIMARAARTLTPVHFELGGNDPALVLEDADLEAAARGIAAAAFRRGGQVCFAVKRVYVHQAVAAEFEDLLVAHLDGMRVGDALDETVTMGPLISRRQCEDIRAVAARARAVGREVVACGVPVGELADGHFHLPTVVLGAHHEDEVVGIEQFGPILPIVRSSSEAEMIRLANDSEYGLCSSIWSQDDERALAIAGRIEAGVTFVNRHEFSPQGSKWIPFGGVKQSGIGWENSPAGLGEFLQYHSIDSRSSAAASA